MSSAGRYGSAAFEIAALQVRPAPASAAEAHCRPRAGLLVFLRTPHCAMPRNSSAFTRVELLALVAALGLLALCTWPALAGSRGDAQRATCFNNLRQIAHGAQLWAGDHGERIPWLTPIAEGGTFTNNLHASAAWFELLTFSNELSSPRLLDRKSTRLNSSHSRRSRMPSSA